MTEESSTTWGPDHPHFVPGYDDMTPDEWFAYISAGEQSAPELSPDEAAIVAKFEAAEPAPESWVQQHRAEGDCFCQPEQVGQDAWQHKP